MQPVNEMELGTDEQVFKESKGIELGGWWIVAGSDDIVQRFVDEVVSRLVVQLDLFEVLLGVLVLVLLDDALDQVLCGKVGHWVEERWKELLNGIENRRIY